MMWLYRLTCYCQFFEKKNIKKIKKNAVTVWVIVLPSVFWKKNILKNKLKKYLLLFEWLMKLTVQDIFYFLFWAHPHTSFLLLSYSCSHFSTLLFRFLHFSSPTLLLLRQNSKLSHHSSARVLDSYLHFSSKP